MVDKLTFDIEADGLLRDATKIWCVAYAFNGGTPELITGLSDIESFFYNITDLNADDLLIGHNISGYDIPLVKKLLGMEFPMERCRDTLIMSQMLEPEEFHHSLESWGEYLGDEKVQHEDWTQYSEAMGVRCKKDCEITYKVYLDLEAKLRKLGGSL